MKTVLQIIKKTIKKILKTKSLKNILKIKPGTPPYNFSAQKVRGFSLVEVLVAGMIGAIIAAGSVKALSIAIQSSRVTESSLAVTELKTAVNLILLDPVECRANLKPNATTTAVNGLTGDDREKGIGTIKNLTKNLANDVAGDTTTTTDNVNLVTAGKVFKNKLDILKIDMIGDATEDPQGNERKRVLIVYYKKLNMGSLSTLADGTCTNTDTSGCYFHQCLMTYELAGNDVSTCKALDCADHSSSSVGDVPYFEVQVDSENLFIGYQAGLKTDPDTDTTSTGCTADNPCLWGQQNLFLGHHAGKSNTKGSYNLFLGYQPGYSSTTGDHNFFSGYRAGYNNTTGNYNLFLGYKAGLSSVLPASRSK